MASEPVKPYFTRLLRVLTFYLEASNGVVFCGNGVVNGVVEIQDYIYHRGKRNRCNIVAINCNQ